MLADLLCLMNASNDYPVKPQQELEQLVINLMNKIEISKIVSFFERQGTKNLYLVICRENDFK